MLNHADQLVAFAIAIDRESHLFGSLRPDALLKHFFAEGTQHGLLLLVVELDEGVCALAELVSHSLRHLALVSDLILGLEGGVVGPQLLEDVIVVLHELDQLLVVGIELLLQKLKQIVLVLQRLKALVHAGRRVFLPLLLLLLRQGQANALLFGFFVLLVSHLRQVGLKVLGCIRVAGVVGVFAFVALDLQVLTALNRLRLAVAQLVFRLGAPRLLAFGRLQVVVFRFLLGGRVLDGGFAF